MTNGNAPLSIFELADLLGRYRFIELALFTVVGEGARRADDASLCVALSGASHAHAYRADLIERQLLVSVGLPSVTESTRSPSPAHTELITTLRTVDSEELAVFVAMVWYPMMLDVYQAHLENCGDPSDGPTRRMLGRIAFDLGVSRAELDLSLGDRTGSSEVKSAREVIGTIGGPFGTLRL